MALKIRLALLSFWVGAMSFFSFLVAPSAFAVLANRRLAGDLVSRTLSGLEILGLTLGIVILILLLVSRSPRRRAFIFELAVMLLMIASTLISRLVVSARLHAMRVQLGDGLDLLPPSDPARITFDTLHQVSVRLMSFNLIAALVLIILLIVQDRKAS